jgi:ribosome-associated toxin RatA of RatAB toxin-antitoxin module
MKTLLIALFLATSQAHAASTDKPHPHQGIVEAYSGKPEKPTLSTEDLAKLAEGKSVMTQLKSGEGGRGMAIQDIHADPATIWSKITDYKSYPGMVDNVKECEVYSQEGDRIKARFILSAALISVEYYIDHVYKPDEGYMTWTLDYSRQSDLDDSVGMWVVEALPEKPGWSRVYYSVDVRLKGWIPGAIENIIAKQGLNKATEWVKRESEAAAGTPG